MQVISEITILHPEIINEGTLSSSASFEYPFARSHSMTTIWRIANDYKYRNSELNIIRVFLRASNLRINVA